MHDCAPKNKLTSQARRLRQGNDMLAAAASDLCMARSCKANGNQKTTAITDSSDQNAKAPGQKPSSKLLRSAVASAASAAPALIPRVYRPVTSATRWGKCALTIVGSCDCATAMPTPTKNVAAKRTTSSSPANRPAVAATIRTTDHSTPRSGPIRSVIHAALKAKTLIHNTGIVVSNPETAPLRPRYGWIVPSTADTEVSAGRRFEATRNSPTGSSTRSRVRIFLPARSLVAQLPF